MINTDQTLEQLTQLKLHGMAQAYGTTLALPSHDLPTAHELMALLVEAEQLSRIHQRTQMYLRLSNLRYDAVIEQIQCAPERNITRNQLLALADCNFIQRADFGLWGFTFRISDFGCRLSVVSCWLLNIQYPASSI